VLLLAQIASQYQQKMQLGGHDQVVHAGLDRAQERLRIARALLVERNRAIVVEKAEIHGSCVQIDAASVLVIAAMESHEVLMAKWMLWLTP
jgi:hypothetical protein